MPKCFVAMPITTPPDLLELYGCDHDHFAHVLDYLIAPALSECGFDVLPPTSEGSTVIHANIVSNLLSADLVLCDMSTRNPNVFFELGIRTALNKPTCHIVDDVTQTVPFDAGIINYHSYSASLAPWELENEKRKLIAHIKATADKDNPLWRYFGITHRAHIPEAVGGRESQLEYIQLTLEQLVKKIDSQQYGSAQPPTPIYGDAEKIAQLLRLRGMSQSDLARSLKVSPAAVSFWVSGKSKPSLTYMLEIEKMLTEAILS